jgi:glycine oxidase
VALEESAARRLQEVVRIFNDRGVTAHYLDRAGVREAEPQLADAVLGGLSVGANGFVGASDLTNALRRAAGAYGVTFSPSISAARISGHEGAMQVETPTDTVSCDAVVMAAGSWSGQVEAEGEEPMPVRPIRGQLLHLGWPKSPPKRVVWTDRCYVVPWTDGSVLVGATVEDVGFDERATVAGVQQLIEMTCKLIPNARKALFRGVRVGLRPGTPDDMPVIGPSTKLPGLFYATGHFRNGVLLAPLTAELVADYLLDQKCDTVLEATSPSRFATS